MQDSIERLNGTDGDATVTLLAWAKAYREEPHELRFPSDPNAEFFPRDMEFAATEIERLRYIIGALVEWRDKPWSPKGISVAGLTSHRETTNLDEQIEKARAETVSVWDAAREAIKPSDRGETG